MLETKPQELQDHIKSKEKALIDHMTGKKPNNNAEVIRDLRSKLSDKDKQVNQTFLI